MYTICGTLLRYVILHAHSTGFPDLYPCRDGMGLTSNQRSWLTLALSFTYSWDIPLANPAQTLGYSKFTITHTNGLHCVHIDYCECDHTTEYGPYQQ